MDGAEGTPAVSAIGAGLRCRCPACGQGKLFDGFLAVAPRCPACGLEFTGLDTGDGPAVFVVLVGGFIVVAGALIVEVTITPPYWMHAAIWLPAILLVTLGLIRPFKATLIALQHKHLPPRDNDRD